MPICIPVNDSTPTLGEGTCSDNVEISIGLPENVVAINDPAMGDGKSLQVFKISIIIIMKDNVTRRFVNIYMQ